MGEIKHYFYHAVVANEYLWFPANDIAALFKMNIHTMKCEYVLSFQKGENTISRLYCAGSAKCGNKVVFIPANAASIAIYDCSLEKLRQIEVETYKYNTPKAFMWRAWQTKEYLYAFRSGYSEIYRINPETLEVHTFDVVPREKKLSLYSDYWGERTEWNEHYVIMYDVVHCILYQYCIDTDMMEILFCFDKPNVMIDFASDFVNTWVLCKNAILYRLSGKMVVDEIDCSDIANVSELGLYCYNGILYVIDKKLRRIVRKIGGEEKKEFSIKLENDDSETGFFFINNHEVFVQLKSAQFYYFDGVNEISGTAESDAADIPNDVFDFGYVNENKSFSINNLVMCTKYNNQNVKENNENNVGLKIFNHMISEDA